MKSFNIFVAFLILAGCSSGNKKYNPHDFIATKKDFDITPTGFTKEKLKQDIDVLIHFFKNGYAGYTFIDQKIVRAAKGKIKDLKSSHVKNWNNLCQEIAIILNELPDGHLMAIDKENCLPEERRKERKSKIGKNIASKHNSKAYHFISKKIGSKNVAVLGISKFPANNDKRWNGFGAVIKKVKSADIVVLDLRGNPGGDDSRGMQLASALKGKEIKKSEYVVDYEPTNPETYVLLLNMMTEQSKTSSDGAWDKYKKLYYDKLATPHSGPYTTLSTNDNMSETIMTKPFTGPVYVLIDSDTRSSGESTTHAFKQLNNTTVVGQNSAGLTHFGNRGVLILPNSRIKVSLSTLFISFKNGDFIEKSGHKPEIRVPDGEDALTYLIKNKLRK